MRSRANFKLWVFVVTLMAAEWVLLVTSHLAVETIEAVGAGSYLLAHALVKAGLFFASGIVLHRLRSISEKVLFGRGAGLYWTAPLWFLGGAGQAAAPVFATSLGEAGASKAAGQAGLHFVSLLFLFGGVMTCAAVWRVGMHTFFGWEDGPLSDRSADVDELPETAEEDRNIFWYHYGPTALCILGAIAISLTRGWLAGLCNASETLVSQRAYLHTVYAEKLLC